MPGLGTGGGPGGSTASSPYCFQYLDSVKISNQSKLCATQYELLKKGLRTSVAPGKCCFPYRPERHADCGCFTTTITAASTQMCGEMSYVNYNSGGGCRIVSNSAVTVGYWGFRSCPKRESGMQISICVELPASRIPVAATRAAISSRKSCFRRQTPSCVTTPFKLICVPYLRRGSKG